jgi:hypothetical protein
VTMFGNTRHQEPISFDNSYENYGDPLGHLFAYRDGSKGQPVCSNCYRTRPEEGWAWCDQCLEEEAGAEVVRVVRVLQKVNVNILGLAIVLTVHEDTTASMVYLQVSCHRPDTYTGAMGWGQGGKAWLAPGAEAEAIVAAAFGLVKAYLEHEAREGFTYEGWRVYGPHMSLEALKAAADASQQAWQVPEEPEPVAEVD